MIKKKCENCVYFNNSICSVFLNEKWCNLKFFKSSEQAIRKDEREKIKDFVITRGEANEKQILKDLYEYLESEE